MKHHLLQEGCPGPMSGPEVDFILDIPGPREEGTIGCLNLLLIFHAVNLLTIGQNSQEPYVLSGTLVSLEWCS